MAIIQLRVAPLASVGPGKLGRLKLVTPSPPYVVPISANSGWFCDMDSTCPWQNIQPGGAKLNATSDIEPIKASITEFLSKLGIVGSAANHTILPRSWGMSP